MSSTILNPFAGQEKSLQYTYAHTLMYSVFVIPRKHVWRSRVEIEGYSIGYFDRIVAFKVPYR